MPLPQFSEDEFLNYCVAEALMFRARREEQEAEKRREIEEWKSKPVGSGIGGG